jgi:hypothetical protein
MSVEELVNKLCVRLKEKVRLLERFGSVTEQMKAALQARRVERVTVYVNERRSVIDRIEQIDREVAAFTKREGIAIERLSCQAKDRLSRCLNEIQGCLKSLAGLDTECMALAGATHQVMKTAALTVRRSLRAAHGYRPSGQVPPRFLDVKR